MPVIFDASFYCRIGVEALDIVRNDPQPDFHFRQTMVFRAHGFAKTGRDRFSGEGSTHKPAQHARQRALMRTQQKKIGVYGKGMANGSQLNAPYGHTGMALGAVQGFACDMVPVRSCFIADMQYQAVIETAGTEVVQASLDIRRQTDVTVANDSERYQERFAGQFALGHVMIGHLTDEQSPFFFRSFKDNKLIAVRNRDVSQFGCCLRDNES